MKSWPNRSSNYAGMASYKLSNQAKEDLIRIHQYGVRNFGEEQADRYLLDFFEQFEIISRYPDRYPKVDYIREGYRRCVCGVDGIYYRVKNETVEIMAIIGRQDMNQI
ncbi:type II toxin-antitoxin system RelE/ParE family toxin [Rhodohalobacter sulfatireducens]|uniref:Type II toxin-antitoxin system RelE/ParE family toxin n=1 Tax=Rhodohalobacter sulfatireducens TaxID=2911366 RepID=A0ABS9KEF7_9BACT|nr:type II toxin-antitoxin system RelE/ParE family toxin [Rhodohalobacter sulfatireducens]MCG2589192.1 type II toxin-antitoxin system RelE/ParE family toxin [Rhodohalobacter sulfatireducens]